MQGTKLYNAFELKAHTNGDQITYISLSTSINVLFDIHLFHGAESIWEANRFSAGQGIPLILCNPNVQYQTYNCPPPVHIMSQINTVQVPLPHFLNIHFNIILPSNPGSSKWTFSFRFPTPPNHVYISPLFHTLHMPAQYLPSLFDHPTNNIWWGVILGSSWHIYLDSLVTSSLLGPNILKAHQFNFLLQCEISTLFSFVLFSLYLQKSNNFVTLFLPFLLAFIPWFLTLIQMALKHSLPFTYGDVTEHSSYHGLQSFAGKPVGCFCNRMYSII